VLAKSLFCKSIEKGVYFHTDFTISAVHAEDQLAYAADTIRSAARQAKAEVL
jgi:hypothetical protein